MLVPLLQTSTHHSSQLVLVLSYYSIRWYYISWIMSADSSDTDILSDELDSPPSRAAGASQKRSTASLKRMANPNEPKKLKGPPSAPPVVKYIGMRYFFAPKTSSVS